jgi:hypothetical protein
MDFKIASGGKPLAMTVNYGRKRSKNNIEC